VAAVAAAAAAAAVSATATSSYAAFVDSGFSTKTAKVPQQPFAARQGFAAAKNTPVSVHAATQVHSPNVAIRYSVQKLN
jgi:hypothetical protein